MRSYHCLCDELDFQRHFDYIHYNPIKHGMVQNLSDYPYSSFHRWVKQGIYPANWGTQYQSDFEFADLNNLE